MESAIGRVYLALGVHFVFALVSFLPGNCCLVYYLLLDFILCIPMFVLVNPGIVVRFKYLFDIMKQEEIPFPNVRDGVVLHGFHQVREGLVPALVPVWLLWHPPLVLGCVLAGVEGRPTHPANARRDAVVRETDPSLSREPIQKRGFDLVVVEAQ